MQLAAEGAMMMTTDDDDEGNRGPGKMLGRLHLKVQAVRENS
jgi:hypothetical protein